tara:strand:+ start:15582 stop:16379 length:798 start_codon:yes stop_codon:yes gene_type:complete
MTKLSPQAQALLDAGRDALSPTAATKAGVLRSLDASLAASTAVAGGSAFAAGKLWLALTLVAGLGGGWFLADRTTSEPQPVNASEQAVQVAEAVPVAEVQVAEVQVAEEETLVPETLTPVTEAPAPPIAPVELNDTIAVPPKSDVQAKPPQANDAKTPRSRMATHQSPQEPKAQPNDLLGERKLIASAQLAIRSKNYSEAKNLLQEHEQSFPKGILGPERQAARAIVNCLEPSGTNGKAIARRFLEAHANSPLAARVRSICELPK